jgi:hypothetical protein
MPLNGNELERLRAASGALTDVMRADSVWTSLVTAPRSPLRVNDAYEVLARFEALQQGIDAAYHAGYEIAEVVDSASARDSAFRQWPKSLAGALESGGSQVALEALQQDQVGYSLEGLARLGSDEMKQGLDDAREMLLVDLQGMLCAGPAKGWLPTTFLCGLAMASMAAGLITVWIPPHAHAAAAVGFGAAVYQSSKCGEKRATP